MAELAGKKALITGAGTGIGRGIALELGARGAAVVFHYHSSEAGAQSAVAEIEAAGGTAAAMQADLSQVSECQRLVQEASNLLGGLDILVNNSGISPEAPFFEVTPEMWDSVHHTNLRSAFFCAQTAAREMLAQGGGKIVHIGSVHGGMSMPGFGAYAASKGGVHGMTRQMAIDLTPYHINVNCVAPGLVEVERYYRQFPDFDSEHAAREVPVGRVGRPRDVAAAVAFLCSDGADWITGQVLYVDGGQMARLCLRRDI